MSKPDKVLLMCEPQSDYGADFLYLGLCEALGPERVVTHPLKKTYYGEIANDYTLPDGKQGMTAPADYMTLYGFHERNEWGQDRILERLTEEFAFVCLTSPRPLALQAYRELFKDKRHPVVVFTDHEDYDTTHKDVVNEFNPYAKFKREMREEKDEWIPLPFSSIIMDATTCSVPDDEKDIDVFAAFGNTFPERKQVLQALQSMSINFVGGGNDFRLSYEEYHQHIARAKVSVAFRGWGMDTVRLWEICPHKTAMIVGQSGQLIPNNFEHEKHCMWFNEGDMNSLRDHVLKLLSDDALRQSIAQAGYDHTMEHHTNKARATHFLDKIKEKAGVDPR